MIYSDNGTGFSKEQFALIIQRINFFAILAFTAFKFWAGNILNLATYGSGPQRDFFNLVIVFGFFAFFFTLFAQFIFAVVSKWYLIVVGIILSLVGFAFIQKPIICHTIVGVKTKVDKTIIVRGWPVQNDACENGFGTGVSLVANAVVFILIVDQLDYIRKDIKKYLPYFKEAKTL